MASTTHPGAAHAVPVINDPRRRRAMLWSVRVALTSVVASGSGVNVAQPQLATECDAAQGQVLWIINTYTLTLAALVLPLGALGDRVGRKPVLIVGLVVFGVANITAAIAPVIEGMLAARLLSGIGAALSRPGTPSVSSVSLAD